MIHFSNVYATSGFLNKMIGLNRNDTSNDKTSTTYLATITDTPMLIIDI